MYKDLDGTMNYGGYIFGCKGTGLSQDEIAFFKEVKPYGFILFNRNLKNKSQIRKLTDELRETVGYFAPILIDQEGGRVQRLTSPQWRDWEPALDICTRLPLVVAKKLMWLQYRYIAAELLELGIDTNCVPLGDLATENTHPVLRNRCYGFSPEVVTAIAAEVADACLQGGVLPVLKHIPGHGSTTKDSHEELPVCDKTRAELEESDFCSFRNLNTIPLGMTAHVLYPEIDSDYPATISAKMIEIIRNSIGFDGLLMADDLSMGALGGSIKSRARKAIDAGCDIILHCNGEMAEMVDIVAESGTMNDLAQERAEKALSLRQKPEEIDLEKLLKDYTLLANFQ